MSIDDRELERHLRGEGEVAPAYRDGAREEPPAALDAAVLAIARDAVRPGPSASTGHPTEPGAPGAAPWWRRSRGRPAGPFTARWSAGFSLAAVIVISVSLVFLTPPEPVLEPKVRPADDGPALDDELTRSARKRGTGQRERVIDADTAANPPVATRRAAQSEVAPSVVRSYEQTAPSPPGGGKAEPAAAEPRPRRAELEEEVDRKVGRISGRALRQDSPREPSRQAPRAKVVPDQRSSDVQSAQGVTSGALESTPRAERPAAGLAASPTSDSLGPRAIPEKEAKEQGRPRVETTGPEMAGASLADDKRSGPVEPAELLARIREHLARGEPEKARELLAQLRRLAPDLAIPDDVVRLLEATGSAPADASRRP